MDADSPTYAKNKHCEFWLQGSGGGVLASPRHSLPRNSTCLYHLRGAGPALPSPTPPRPLPKFPEQRPGTVWRRPAPRAPQPQFRVWLSILKFHVGTSLSTGDEDCSTTLMVWDGEMMPLSECYDPTIVTARRSINVTVTDPVQTHLILWQLAPLETLRCWHDIVRTRCQGLAITRSCKIPAVHAPWARASCRVEAP